MCQTISSRHAKSCTVSYPTLKADGLPASTRIVALWRHLTLSPLACLRATPALVSFKILMAELISLSWMVPQMGHCHSRTDNGSSSRTYSQWLQVLLEGKKRSTLWT